MHTLLRRFGLTRKESDVFLTLLSLGAQPVSVVAKHAGIPRSSMYFVLDRLREAQLIEEFERAGVKFVKCVPVQSLKDILMTRERQIRQTLDLLEEELPKLTAMESSMSITPKVKFSEGREAVMRMYESLLGEKDYCTFFNPAVVSKMLPEYYEQIPTALREAGGKARELLVRCPEATAYRDRYASPRHQIRLLPEGMTFSSDCILCGDRICMVAYGERQVSAVEIFAPPLAETQRALFEQLWKTAE